MKKNSQNLMLSKLRRPALLHSPSGKADAFFGKDELADILYISDQSIDYKNEKNEKISIYFAKIDTHYNLPEKRYVGYRALSSPPPAIQFFDEKNTLFEFQSIKLAHEFLEKLSNLKFWTIDID